MHCIHILTRALAVRLRVNFIANRRAVKLKVHIFVSPGWHHQISVHPLEQSSLTAGRLGGYINPGSYCPGGPPAGLEETVLPSVFITQTAKRSRFHNYNQGIDNCLSQWNVWIYAYWKIYVQCSRWPVHPSMHGFNLKSFRQLKWQSLHTLSSRTHPQTPDSQLLLTQPRKTVNQEETVLLSIAAKKSKINNVLHVSVVSSGYLSCCCCPSSQPSLTSDSCWRDIFLHTTAPLWIFSIFGSCSVNPRNCVVDQQQVVKHLHNQIDHIQDHHLQPHSR